MLRGLPASLILHLAVVGTTYIVLPHTSPPLQAVEIVPVDIVTVSEVTNVVAVRRTENPPEPETEEPPTPQTEPDIEDFLEDLDVLAEETDVVVEEETPPPPPDKAEEEKPEDIVPEEPDEKEPEPEEEAPEPDPKKDEKPRDALDDLLADNPFAAEDRVLIDKTARARAAPLPPPVEQTEPKEVLTNTPQRGVGERTANEARIESLLWSKMVPCWQEISDLPDPERLAVRVRVYLERDGTFKRDVELVTPRRAPIGDRFMGQAIDRALRAARKCQPYNLPAEDYEIWNEITMNFRLPD